MRPDRNALVGSWSGSSSSTRVALSLDENGRFRMRVEAPAAYMVDDETCYEGRWEIVGDDEISFDLDDGAVRSATGVFHAHREALRAQEHWRIGYLRPDGTLDVREGPYLTKTSARS